MTPIHPVWGYIAGGFIVSMLVTFIGIWIWAWRRKHLPTFDRMAKLPLEDESDLEVDTNEDRP